MTVLYRYAKYKELDTSATADLSDYTDMGNISNWALDAMVGCGSRDHPRPHTHNHCSPGNLHLRRDRHDFKWYIEDFLDKVD